MPRLNLKKAAYLQRRLAGKVITVDDFNKPIRYIGGVDVAYKRRMGIGVATLLEYDSMKLVEYKHYITEVDVPYVPTFLAFREIPPMVGAIEKLDRKPDIMLVDAHGLVHPRGLGAASHIGVVLDIPTIGVAKSPLVGKVDEEGYIVYKGKRVGYKLGPKLYVSIGHRVSLETAIEIVKNTLRNSIPEPTRLAHIYANKLKREIEN